MRILGMLGIILGACDIMMYNGNNALLAAGVFAMAVGVRNLMEG